MKLSIVAIMLFLTPPAVWAEQPVIQTGPCPFMFTSYSTESSSQQDLLISLLTQMEDNGLLGEKELNDILNFFDGADWPDSENGIAASLHWKLLREWIRSFNGSRDLLRRLFESRLQLVRSTKVQRSGVIEKTADYLAEPNFLRIPGGSFEWEGQEVDIPYDLEVMQTPVTLGMWAKLMGVRPERMAVNVLELNKGTVNSSVLASVKVGEEWVEIALDHPVSYVSSDTAAEFANRLSIARGVSPAYLINFNRLNGFNASLLREMAGFRLPTRYEWLRMIREFSQTRKNAADPIALLQNVGWFFPGTSDFKRPVRSFSPIHINGQPFYDFLGNVSETVHGYSFDLALKSGDIDSVSRLTGVDLVGGSFQSACYSSSVFADERCDRDLGPSASAGFRLVRSVPKGTAR